MGKITASLPERSSTEASFHADTELDKREPVEVIWKDNNLLSLRSRTSRALIYANPFDDEGEEIIPRVRRL
jgi:hypothetical protein